MNIKCLILISALISQKLIFAQKIDTLTQYAKNISIDTILAPDYYKTEISISEYYIYPNKKPYKGSVKMSLDSVKAILTKYLRQIAIKLPNNCLKIEENTNTPSWESPLLVATFGINIYNKDTINLILNYLINNMPEKSLYSLKSEAYLTSETIETMNKKFESICYSKAKKMAKEFADSNNLKIIEPLNYNFDFHSNPNNKLNYSNQISKFKIDFTPLVYNFQGIYIFRMK